MPKRWIRPLVSRAQTLLDHPLLERFAPYLQHPQLWHINRRSVPGAIAIGLFAGLIPGPFQMPTALFLALLCKKNLPLALVVTLYTNPLTWPFLLSLAYALGRTLGFGNGPPPQSPPSGGETLWETLFSWFSQLGTATLMGLPILALTLALCGYLLTHLLWRIALWQRLRRRSSRRSSVGDSAHGRTSLP
ncbi:MAG: DUF2062 domain-containing protein [Hydrogenophilus sp.]|nr:DUF2062 domain-containing protein [Hydrogenophilus sp.]